MNEYVAEEKNKIGFNYWNSLLAITNTLFKIWPFMSHRQDEIKIIYVLSQREESVIKTFGPVRETRVMFLKGEQSL